MLGNVLRTLISLGSSRSSEDPELEMDETSSDQRPDADASLITNNGERSRHTRFQDMVSSRVPRDQDTVKMTEERLNAVISFSMSASM